jgi:electron transfer flavoprotein beta subunit
MKAKKKPIVKKTIADLGLDPSEFAAETARIRITGLEKPQERQPGRIIDGGLDVEGKAAELVRSLHEEAKLI